MRFLVARGDGVCKPSNRPATRVYSQLSVGVQAGDVPFQVTLQSILAGQLVDADMSKHCLGAVPIHRGLGDNDVDVHVRIGKVLPQADAARPSLDKRGKDLEGTATTAFLEALAAGPRDVAAAAMRALTHRLLPLSPAEWPPVAELVASVRADTDKRFAHADHNAVREATEHVRQLVFAVQQLLLRLRMPDFQEPPTTVGGARTSEAWGNPTKNGQF